ncbi:uncharacterized protein LOC103523915 [Nephila pilipes]|uniref:Uncharacterized protein LOC103523915 n=1 Tax=Nephila pilipes TaxID=299642 RepID=A0A8X6ILG3_NEPPI|nr:uncharacterized protein LOC103523915 [Nephila pilipes]
MNDWQKRLLKTQTSLLLENNYPKQDWKRVYTDGSELKDAAEAGGPRRGKSWENIANYWKEFSRRSRKEAVANFRLKTRHDCLAEHLKRIGILTNSLCPIHKTDTMNREHFLVCPGLDLILQLGGDVCQLYWSARECMS